MNKEIELKPCRESFEAWYGSHKLPGYDEFGNYKNPWTQARWEAWQAALQHNEAAK
jgi:hypothetical protein